MDEVATSRQVLIDARYHKHYVTLFKRNPQCRFDHTRVWNIERLRKRASELTVAEALLLGAGRSSLNRENSVWLGVKGSPFVKALVCPACGRKVSLLRLRSSLVRTERTCPECRVEMIAAGFDLAERLEGAVLLRPRLLSLSLSRLGFRPGEVFSVGSTSGERHFEIGDDSL